MIQVDMSEYMEKHSVSRLVKLASGLHRLRRRRPADRGRAPEAVLRGAARRDREGAPRRLQHPPQGPQDELTDAQGRKVDFRNTIVIMTSNIGASSISKNQSLGFSIGDDSGLSYDDMKEQVMSELKKVFRPELLNRIDEVIVFHKLTREEIMLIVDLLLMKRLGDQMGEHDEIELTPEAKELLVEKG